jgi:5-methylthioadenosine/S-adenosylhomocysteine deaminase
MEGVLSGDWVIPVEGPPIRDGAVAFADGRIAAVGPARELGPGRRFADAVILPGFVNAHSHLEYSAYVGFGDGLAFAPWLKLHIARKQQLQEEDFVALARLGAAESLASGVTTVGDASFSGAAARACAELGLRALVYVEVFGDDPAAARARYEETRARVEDCFCERVRPGISPHAPYSVSLEVFAWCRSLGLPVATHLAESPGENEWLLHGRGPMADMPEYFVAPRGETGIRSLARAGLLDASVTAAHCVVVDEEELGLLAEHDVGVAHCARSNALLGCGVAPVAALRAAGVRIGIGSDSPASTPSFDHFDELRAALLLARAREADPHALTAADALELATLGGARALGLDADVGSLAPGKRADLTVVTLAGSPLLPWEDPAAAVVLGGAPARVDAVYVDGSLRYERGRFEWHDLRQRAAAARSRMLRVGAPLPLSRSGASAGSTASTSSGGRSAAQPSS